MGGHPVQTSSNAVSNDKCLVVTNPFVISLFITHLCKIAVQLRVGGVYQYSRTRRWRKFQKGKIYNAEEHVAIESFVTTLIH